MKCSFSKYFPELKHFVGLLNWKLLTSKCSKSFSEPWEVVVLVVITIII